MNYSKITTAAVIFCLTMLTSASAFAQVDLAGTWGAKMHEEWIDKFHGPDISDFLGLPLNDSGRARALSYSSSELAMPDHQCLWYPPYYMMFGPQSLQMWSEDEPVTGRVIAWHLSGASDRVPRTIWMDGRPHPSKNAAHTFDGFSTGEWDGTMLNVYTTHMKAGYIRRNGAPVSDETTLTEHFVRHGNLLTVTAVIDDPVYFSEPQVVSRSWQLDSDLVLNRYARGCTPVVEVERLGVTGTVPHYLPGQNPFADETIKMYNLPAEAVYGEARTRYPEYRKTIRSSYVAPKYCVRYCCGWLPTSGPAGNDDAPGLNCTPAVQLKGK